jgi:hypothetical protein
MTDNDTLLNPFGKKDYPVQHEQITIVELTENFIWVSECCTANPIGELDMSSIPFGGPSGFCGRCHDNCIFIVEDTD